MRMRAGTAAGLIGWILISFSAGAFGTRFSPGAWFEALAKPAWQPPSWVFGPVWTVLYVMIGVAAWMVWKEHGFRGAPLALGLFLVQLVPNALWSWLFFGLQRPDLALVDIAVLLVLVAATAVAFWRHRAAAGALLLPYLAWVGFATVLTAAIWSLNR